MEAYDAVGNRLTRVHDDGSVVTQTLTYTPNSNRVATHNGNTVTIDSAGNTKADISEDLSFVYDDHNRMAEAYVSSTLRATYTYNGHGQRVKKVEATGDERTFIFHYGPRGQLLGETVYDNVGALIEEQDYVWLDTLPVAQSHREFSGATITDDVFVYIHADQLETPRLATNTGGTVVWRWDSDAFGLGEADTDPDSDANDVSVWLRFPGQFYDEETSLSYNYFRDYDAVTGRYTQSDPIGLDGGLNPYLYANGNPLRYADPYGLFGMDDVWGAIYAGTGGWSPSQNTVDFGAGFGDVVTFGLTRQARGLMDIGNVSVCSKWYTAGELAGFAASTATGFVGGTRWFARQASGPNNFSNFSHSLTPNTWQRGSWWSRTGNRANGDYLPVPGSRPDLHDLMDATAAGIGGKFKTWPAWRRLMNRLPYTPGGALYGGASAAANDCGCGE